MRQHTTACRDCHDLDRRRFLRTVGGAAVASAAAPLLFDARMAHAAPTPTSAAESLVAKFYESLSADQKKAVCLPFDHSLRSRISANWHVTDHTIGDEFYSDEQRSLIEQIVKNVTSEEGYERFVRQMDDDDGGLLHYSVAVFGEPGSGKFEWELTGRHLTLRADGDSVDHAAFGGPIVYGHGEEIDVAKNLFHYQTKRANEVFQALDGVQRQTALVKEAPSETDVQLRGNQGKFAGIRVGDLSADQQQLVSQTLKTLLDPYRAEDVEEVHTLIQQSGGTEALHMAFYQEGDIDNDQTWDIWRIEGPGMVWHFRGAPHVHAYINIARAVAQKA